MNISGDLTGGREDNWWKLKRVDEGGNRDCQRGDDRRVSEEYGVDEDEDEDEDGVTQREQKTVGQAVYRRNRFT